MNTKLKPNSNPSCSSGLRTLAISDIANTNHWVFPSPRSIRLRSQGGLVAYVVKLRVSASRVVLCLMSMLLAILPTSTRRHLLFVEHC